MSMKLSQLKTHWSADDAHLVLSFLDELRDALWAAYGAEVIEQQHQESQTSADYDDLNFGSECEEEEHRF